MHDTGRVDVFQAALHATSVSTNRVKGPSRLGVCTNHDLVQEVLDELLLEGARGEKPVEIGAEQFSDKVAADHIR